jgi:hypothetical protein
MSAAASGKSSATTHLGCALGRYRYMNYAPCGALLVGPDPELVQPQTHDPANVTCLNCLAVTEALAKVFNKARRFKTWPGHRIRKAVSP